MKSTDSNRPTADLTTPVHYLKGVGPKRRRELEKAGLRTVGDLLYHLPFRYEDRRTVRPVATLRAGEAALVSGRIVSAEVQRTRRRRFTIFRAVFEDDTGGRLVAAWFNQPYLAEAIKPGYRINLYGEVCDAASGGGVLEMLNPAFEVGSEAAGETGIVPIYRAVGSVGGRVVRGIIKRIFDAYRVAPTSCVPAEVSRRLGLVPTGEALRRVHCPTADADPAALNAGRAPEQRSLVFDEFFFLQAGLAVRKSALGDEESGIAFRTSPSMRETLRRMLPFRLTPGQRNAFKEIVGDMTSPRPMRRLLQGDVGCGKTIVALLAAALAVENGYQAALMAPTELLAEQHFAAVRGHLAHTDYRVRLLLGGMAEREKGAARAALAAGEIDLVVGTHALIQKGTGFQRLGLVIIDEQHRFGVAQRGRLMEKGSNPDVLIMTATPIPRSLTLTLFGDLGISVIRDMPPGRRPVVTAARTERSRARINSFLESQMREGRQVYALAPAIEEAEDGDMRSAVELCERLRRTFPHRRVALLHGRMAAAEREGTMAAFVAGEIDVLACTTVIEVGVDVPNASVMLVENAERFGLSQLHQLRGRVGRGEHRGYCILLYRPTRSDPARRRLEVVVKTNDGFVIAEKDLELRGPGDFGGTRQSGFPALLVGNIVRDAETLEAARREAFRLLLEPRPGEQRVRARLVAAVRKGWERRYGLVLIG